MSAFADIREALRLARISRIARLAAAVAAQQTPLSRPTPAGAEGRARPGDGHCGGPNTSASQGVPTLDPLGSVDGSRDPTTDIEGGSRPGVAAGTGGFDAAENPHRRDATQPEPLGASSAEWSAVRAPVKEVRRRTSSAEGEEVHPGCVGHGVLARAAEPPRGVPATAAAQIKRWRDALELIAGRGCSGGYEPGRCLDLTVGGVRGVARNWWCLSCIAAEALSDREAVWP